MNGVYLQLHAYMLRVAIPYGTLSSQQMRMLAHVARRYDRGYGHFTTRQNIHTTGSSSRHAGHAGRPGECRTARHADLGNCVRNITTDQWRVVAADEIEIRASLPRCCGSIRRCIRNSRSCRASSRSRSRLRRMTRAAVKVHDIGLRMVRNDAGDVGFEVIVGGGSAARRSSARSSGRSCPSATS